MKEERYKCPLCHIFHNNLSKEFKNINTFKEGSILCSSCIRKILNEDNHLVFPEDLVIHRISEIEEEKESDNINDIRNTDNNEVKHELNKSIIDEIKRDSMNKTLIQEMKHQSNNKFFITNLKTPKTKIKENNSKNPLNLSYHSKSYKNINPTKNYYIKKTIKPNNNQQEKEIMENISELNNIYMDIEKNKNIFNSFNQKFFNLIENINDKFIQLEGQLAEIKKEIIDNIDSQFKYVLNFINLRRKEIFDKFQYCNYDISELINSSLIWMKTVKKENNELNIINLINTGKEINNRYNFIKEINEIFKLLEEYKENGMNIIKNDYTEMPVIIKENKEIIKLLNLTPYNDISNESNKNKSIENTDMNNNSSINNENSKIYCKKLIEDKIRHNNTVSNFYKNKNQRRFKSMKKEIVDTTNNHSVNFNRISVSRIKNDFNYNTESNEPSFPFLYSSGNTNVNNSEKKNTGKNKNQILGYKKQHESIQVNNETDNNININFNGHIFNYNSDSNISIIIPEKNKNNKNINSNKIRVSKNINKNKTKTPKKIGIKNKFGKSNIKKSSSFRENMNNNNHNKINKIKNQNFTCNNIDAINNINKKILNIKNKENIINNFYEKTFINFIKNNNNKKNKNRNNNYKTLNNKELEKYVNYQLKKVKQNFSRINLRDLGIKLICSFYKNNKDKIYKEIKLQGCNLNDNDLELLIKCLIDNDITIPIINLSENELTDHSLEAIINLINENEGITNLILTNNSFSKKTKDKLKEIAKNKKEELFDFNIQI